MLLDAAHRIYDRKGVEATTVKDITAEADVAHGSFYNHFKSVDDVAAALSAQTFRRVAAAVTNILAEEPRVQLLPCIGARVVVRMLLGDPATRWIIGRPRIFVNELSKVSVPFMQDMERDAVMAGLLRPVGGHEAWMRSYPWLLLGQLDAAIVHNDYDEAEDRFARISLRFLGVPDELAQNLLADSLRLVDRRLPRPDSPRSAPNPSSGRGPSTPTSP